MKALSAPVCLVFAMGLLCGCTIITSNTSTSSSGREVSDETLAQVTPGETTKAWVIAALGEPSSVSAVDEQVEILRYAHVHTAESKTGFLILLNAKQKKEKRETVLFEFENGVLRRYWRTEE